MKHVEHLKAQRRRGSVGVVVVRGGVRCCFSPLLARLCTGDGVTSIRVRVGGGFPTATLFH